MLHETTKSRQIVTVTFMGAVPPGHPRLPLRLNDGQTADGAASAARAQCHGRSTRPSSPSSSRLRDKVLAREEARTRRAGQRAESVASNRAVDRTPQNAVFDAHRSNALLASPQPNDIGDLATPPPYPRPSAHRRLADDHATVAGGLNRLFFALPRHLRASSRMVARPYAGGADATWPPQHAPADPHVICS